MQRDNAAPTESVGAGNKNLPTVPVSFMKNGENGTIAKVSGNEETRKFLSGLGFVQGTSVRTVSNSSTGIILEVKGSRIAIDNRMGSRIHVTQ
jgi:ferrous iron transport protein A